LMARAAVYPARDLVGEPKLVFPRSPAGRLQPACLALCDLTRIGHAPGNRRHIACCACRHLPVRPDRGAGRAGARAVPVSRQGSCRASDPRTPYCPRYRRRSRPACGVPESRSRGHDIRRGDCASHPGASLHGAGDGQRLFQLQHSDGSAGAQSRRKQISDIPACHTASDSSGASDRCPLHVSGVLEPVYSDAADRRRTGCDAAAPAVQLCKRRTQRPHRRDRHNLYSSRSYIAGICLPPPKWPKSLSSGNGADMTQLELQDVSKIYPGAALPAIDGLSLSVEEGALTALLGPSASGKSTILKMIAGLIDPTSGDIRLRGRSILSLPPDKRDIVLVFQEHLLFPHLNVADNIGFGLRMRRQSRAEIARDVDEMMDLLRLGGLAARKPAALSGGQQQRVALARALVLRPKLLLLDEPFANLDAPLRIEMQSLLKSLQQSTGTTMLFVTHDQSE